MRKLTAAAAALLLILTSVMYGQIANNKNHKIESLSVYGTIGSMQENPPGQIEYSAGGFVIRLDSKRQYEIHRIDLIVTDFSDGATGVHAYPKFEQFSIVYALDASIRNVNGTSIRKKLFNNLIYSTSDGISSTKVLFEPFIFTTQNDNDNYLWIETTNIASSFTALTGIVLPPITGVNMNAVITLEGVSYDIPTAAHIKSNPYLRDQ